MRIVRIANPDPSLPDLEFHPKLTVVTGLSGADQLQLCTALHAVLTAQPIDLATVVGVGDNEITVTGVAPVPPGAEDASPVLTPETFLMPVIKTDEAARRALAAEVEEASEGIIEAKLYRGELSDALEAAQNRLDPSATRSLADVAGSVADLEAQLGMSPGQATLVNIEKIRTRRAELVALTAALDARTQWLGAEGDRVVRNALAALRDATATDNSVSLTAQVLADDWSRAQARFETAEARLASNFGDVDRLAARLDASVKRFEEANDRSTAKPQVSEEDIAMLEEAHDRVVEAESRVTGRASIYRPELVVARRAEQRILDRVGFATWAEFMLEGAFDASSNGPGRELELAKRDLMETQKRWDEFSRQFETNEELSAATAELDRVEVEAKKILGDFDDIESALRSHRVRVADRAPSALDDAQRDMIAVLEALGFEELASLESQDLLQIGFDWQHVAKQLQPVVAELETARGACAAEVARLDQTIAQDEEGVAAAEPDPRIDLMVSILVASEASFDRNVQAQLDLSHADEQIAILERQLDRLETLEATKSEELATAEEPSAWVPVDAPTASQTVVDHFTNLRNATDPALPAVLDQPLSVLDIAAQTSVLVDFMDIADGVQVIWFNPERLIVDWATSLGDQARVLRFTDANH